MIDRVGNGRFDNWIIIFSGVLEFKVVDVTICSMWLESMIIFVLIGVDNVNLNAIRIA